MILSTMASINSYGDISALPDFLEAFN